MSVVIPDGYALARFGFLCQGDNETMVTTLGFSIPSTGTAQDIADDIHSVFRTQIASAANMLPTYTSLPTSITMNRGGGPFEVIAGTPLTGTNAAVSGPPPPNVAYLMRKLTAQPGRAGKGRMYLPPFGSLETNIDQAGIIDAADVSALTTRWNNARTAWAGDGNIPVVLHSAIAGVPDVITNFILDSKVATQRRRLR